MSEVSFSLKALTPLWTGGVDQTCDRLHETGLIGSLRWWYEALLRSMPKSYVCDPTSEDPGARCYFDTRAYEKAIKKGLSSADAISKGLKTVCPACFLFGTTGWARLFQLRAVVIPTTKLEFLSALAMNRIWLEKVFHGVGHVPYGNLEFVLTTRRQYEDYAVRQFALALQLAANLGGIGARTQYGFGQVTIGLPPKMEVGISEGIEELSIKLGLGVLRSSGPPVDAVFNISNLVSMEYKIPKQSLDSIIKKGSNNTKDYLPCAFDLRYKGSGKWGMRRWLKQEGWKESDSEDKLGELDLLMGPRSQWGGHTVKKINENLRTAGKVFFGMPYRIKDDNHYTLRIWAFWSPELKDRLQNPEELRNLCNNYVRYVLGESPIAINLDNAIPKVGLK